MSIDRHDAVNVQLSKIDVTIMESIIDLLYLHLFHTSNLLFLTRQRKFMLYHKATLHLFVLQMVEFWNQ